MNGTWSLADDKRVQVAYQDGTRFGSAVTGSCDERLRGACEPLVERWRTAGIQAVLREADELLAVAWAGPLAAWRRDQQTLHEACLYPPAHEVVPSGISVVGGSGDPAVVPLPSRVMADLAAWLGDWQKDAVAPRGGPARRLWDALVQHEVLVPTGPAHACTCSDAYDVRYVGHACVSLRAGGDEVLVDPYLLPWSSSHPDTYQPMTPRCVAHDLRAVLISHSHPDHFDVASLLRLGADTPIVVPAIERESLLSVDMAARLEELGFRRVIRMGWGEQQSFGRFVVRALPFYGEQPTCGDVLHPEVRNVGNLYVVDDGRRRVAFAVDSGRDHLGDAQSVARRDVREHGPVHTVFGGYRSFATYPVHYLFSAVARYFLFVPDHERHVRQKIMHDSDDLLDLAETWRASFVVPYADGGAPWFWERGLGPVLSGRSSTDSRGHHAVDLPPECVREAAAQRSSSARHGLIASAVGVAVLRPGDAGRMEAGGISVARHEPHAWPYGDVA